MKYFFSALALFSGIFWSTETLAASCPLIAPESCYRVNPEGSSALEGWTDGDHCARFGSQESITFSDPKICEKLDVSCGTPVQVKSIQDIVRPFVRDNATNIWTEDFLLTQSHYQNYHQAIGNLSKPLETQHWTLTQETLKCDDAGTLLTDGKYGYCTRYALQLYLDKSCLSSNSAENPSTQNQLIIIGNGIDAEAEDQNDESVFDPTGELLLGAGICKKYVAVFDQSGKALEEFADTASFCQDLGFTGENKCSLQAITGEEKIPEKTKDYESVKKKANELLSQNARNICLEENTDRFICENNQSLRMPKILGGLSQTDSQKIPGISDWLFANALADESDTSDNFSEPAICQKLFKRDTCTVQEIREIIPEEKPINYWNATGFSSIKNVPQRYITEAQEKKCTQKSDATGDQFDVCTRLALAKYLLAEHCEKCPNEPDFFDENYDQYQEYKNTPNAKTPCECGVENFDYENMICPSTLFQWDEDQLRPKYLTGSNWESRKYKGDASDLTFWMQKFGNKITSYAAALAVLFIVFNGFMLVTAAGDEDQINKAKTGIRWALIGLVLLGFAYIIVKTVISLAY